MSKKLLVTGGAGFIGSHCVVELLNVGFDVVIADNFFNSTKECITRIEKITNRKIEYFEVDIRNKAELEPVFAAHQFHAVLHCAAYKNVGESMFIPLEYYKNNITGTINLLECMRENNIKNLVFSSSCTVYGQPEHLPLNETCPTIGSQISNPYGRTKYVVEFILKDLYASDKTWNFIILRYFNPVGAHESGLIGEDPKGAPGNLMPLISQVAIGKRDELLVFGDDYDTRDGTCIRDYTHVYDLAVGHMLAMRKLEQKPGIAVYNLATGNGYSVMEVIHAFEKVSQKKVNYRVVGRRAGDLAEVFADPALAEKELGFKTVKNLEDMCRDLWNWQTKNPNGFSSQ